MTSSSKKKKRTKDPRSTVMEVKRKQDLDANKLALEPAFEIGYSPVGVTVTEHCNVTEQIDSSQGTGSPAPPAQVTGLAITVVSNTQLNQAWNAQGSIDFYNLYRSTTSGFTPSSGNLIAQPSTNSNIDTGLLASTTYYYKCSATDYTGVTGAMSAQAQGTTLAAPPGIARSMWLELNNNFNDSSGNGSVVTNVGTTFDTPGKFGSHYGQINLGNSGANSDAQYFRIGSNNNIKLDTTVGFSISLWIYPWFGGSSSTRSYVIMHKCDNTSAPNDAAYSIEGNGVTGKLIFTVGKLGTFYKAEIASMPLGQWIHVVCTFDGATNTPKVYKNKVVGTSSSLGVVGSFGTTTTLYVGKHPNNTVLGTDDGATNHTTWFSGYTDEIQYFKGVVLTQTQVNNLYATNAP